MYKAELVLKNETGLHARPASMFISEACKYVSDIKIIKDGKEYNGKSIISVLSMGAGKGDRVTILARGQDEKEAVDGLVELIENGFGERGD